MYIIDEKFKTHKRNYFLQILLATAALFVILLALRDTTHSDILSIIGSTSLGASAFITFCAHDGVMCAPRRMLGGYLICVLIGVIGSYIARWFGITHHDIFFTHEVAAAVSAGIAMFFMAVLDLEHPPAAGLAVGLVLELWTWPTLIVILVAVIGLAILKLIFRRWMINLV